MVHHRRRGKPIQRRLIREALAGNILKLVAQASDRDDAGGVLGVGFDLGTVSYTHLTLPTILLV